MSIEALSIDHEQLAAFCMRWGIVELALFGSVLREDFDPERSDVDVLVEFNPGSHLSLIRWVRMADELSKLLGQKVDLVPKDSLKPSLRQPILTSARVVYVAA